MSDRNFHFSVSILVRDAQLMAGGLREDIGAPVAKRLPATFIEEFARQIAQVSTGSTGQKAASGHTGQLTQVQNAALAEVKRLTTAARKTAKLAYPDNAVLLRQSFQVGNSDVLGLASILERAIIVQNSCVEYAADLSAHGWIPDDTTALAAAIETLKGADETQEVSKGDKKAVTAARNAKANKLYAMCQTVQNTVELAYPESKAASNEKIVAARTRFLMDAFPPQPGAVISEETPPPPASPT